MINIDEDIEEYLLYYSDLLDKETGEIIRRRVISSEEEASRLLSFISLLCWQSTLDMEEKKIVLGWKASVADADKASLAILNILEECGYQYLVSKWQPRILGLEANQEGS